MFNESEIHKLALIAFRKQGYKTTGMPQDNAEATQFARVAFHERAYEAVLEKIKKTRGLKNDDLPIANQPVPFKLQVKKFCSFLIHLPQKQSTCDAMNKLLDGHLQDRPISLGTLVFNRSDEIHYAVKSKYAGKCEPFSVFLADLKEHLPEDSPIRSYQTPPIQSLINDQIKEKLKESRWTDTRDRAMKESRIDPARTPEIDEIAEQTLRCYLEGLSTRTQYFSGASQLNKSETLDDGFYRTNPAKKLLTDSLLNHVTNLSDEVLSQAGLDQTSVHAIQGKLIREASWIYRDINFEDAYVSPQLGSMKDRSDEEIKGRIARLRSFWKDNVQDYIQEEYKKPGSWTDELQAIRKKAKIDAASRPM